jgi:hypothetical protein
MTTPKQLAANQANGAHSTGPTTPDGKARSSKNALRHGLRSAVPVLPGERAEDWQEHRDGILRSLAPVGTLEQSLAERVALCLWRLQRVAAYETGVTAVGLDEVEEVVHQPRNTVHFMNDPEPDAVKLRKVQDELAKRQEAIDTWADSSRLMQALPGLPDEARVDGCDACSVLQDTIDTAADYGDPPDLGDEDFFAGLGVPEEELEDPGAWNGWTAGLLRKGLSCVAGAVGLALEKLLARATAKRQGTQEQHEAQARELEREVKRLRQRLRVQEDRLRQQRLLPDAKTLGTLTRYEAHLSRQMLQALHELQRLQAARAGEPVPPPAALDVTVDAGEGAPPALPPPD